MAAMLFVQTLHAQVWAPVSVLSGTQTLGPQTVTVSSSGSVSSTGMKRCYADPYWIGANYQGVPGDYQFDFSQQVSAVRLRMTATNIGEVIQFFINGVHHPLTAANLNPLLTCDTQYALQNTVNGAGNVIFPGPIIGATYFGRFGSCEVVINYPAGISSLRVHNNGIEGGTTFSLEYWGYYALAQNNNPCAEDTLFLSGAPDDPAVTYSWTGPNGFTSSLKDPVIPNAGPQHEGVYRLRVTLGGLVEEDTTEVFVRPLPPKPSIAPLPAPCQGENIRLEAASPEPGITYHWTGPNRFSSMYANPGIRNVRYRDTGLYIVRTQKGGCYSHPEEVRLQLKQGADSDTSEVWICAGGTYDFYGHQLDTAGVYSYIHKGRASNGCDSAEWIELKMHPLPVSRDTVHICQGGSFELGDSVYTRSTEISVILRTPSACDSMVVISLVVDPAPADTVTGYVCAGGTFTFYDQQLYTPGFYEHLIRTESGCDSIAVLQLLSFPEASVQVTSVTAERLCIGDSVTLSASGEGLTSYEWSTAGVPAGAGREALIGLEQIRNVIDLTVTDTNDCRTSHSVTVSAEACCTVYTPNAFSPNGDGKNDLFRSRPQGHMEFMELTILDRWGNVVFRNGGADQGWDGTVNGSPAEIGTYFYQVRGKCLSGDELFEKGDLMLVR